MDYDDVRNKSLQIYANTYFLNSAAATFFEVSTLNVTIAKRDYTLENLHRLRS